MTHLRMGLLLQQSLLDKSKSLIVTNKQGSSPSQRQHANLMNLIKKKGQQSFDGKIDGWMIILFTPI
jgi:hypothetical protein